MTLVDGGINSLPDYVYTELSQPYETRMLTLLRGEGNAIIKCQLSEISYAVDYDALSYTWGDPSLTCLIECDGKKLAVTKNLHSALRRLRLADEDYLLWVDAICINQGHDAEALWEKGFQVRRMGETFYQAKTVIADLGEEDEDSRIALNLVGAVLRLLGEQKPMNLTETFLENEYPLTDEHKNLWLSWARFMARPWFERVWVIQEVVLSQNFKMVVGETEIAPHLLDRANKVIVGYLVSRLRMLSDRIELQNTLKAGIKGAFGLNIMLWLWVNDGDEHRMLKPLLQLSNDFKASEERDHIYALFGMAVDARQSRFEIDYSEPTSQLSERVAKFLVEEGHGIYVLSQSSPRENTRPSWVPDFCTFRPSSICDKPFDFQTGDRPSVYSAAAKTTSRIRYDDNQKCLLVDGVVFDTISRLLPRMPFRTYFDKAKYLTDVLSYYEAATAELIKAQSDHNAGQNHVPKTPPASSSTSSPEIRLKVSLLRTILTDTTDNQQRLARPNSVWTTELLEMFVRNQSHQADTSMGEHKGATQSEAHDINTLTSLVEESSTLLEAMNATMHNRRICITQRGLLGLVPEGVQAGDRVAVFLGGHAPFVLQPVANSPSNELVGTCYVHEMMDGQVLELEDRVIEEIALV